MKRFNWGLVLAFAISISIWILIFALCCCSSPMMQKGEVEFVGEPEWVIFCIEEWEGHKETYLRTFGEVAVTGTIQNTGMGEAKNVTLAVELYEDKDCTMLMYEGESLICSRLSVGVAYEFTVKHMFGYINQAKAKGVRLGVSND